MFKFSKKFVAIVATTLSLSFIAPVTSQLMNQPAITASAHAVQADGPWETSSDGTNVLQHVSNGNEIYYSIAPGTKYAKYAISAANAWSNLGVINLVQVPWGDSRSQINVSYDGNNEADDDNENAETDFENVFDTNGISYPTTTSIKLTDGLSDETKVQKEVTVEHEFGHALGFKHDNRHLQNGHKYRYYVMTMSADSGNNNDVYVLGGIEQHTLADHYNITPDTWLNTNC